LLFNFASEYISSGRIVIEWNTSTPGLCRGLLETSKEVDLEVNTDRTKYRFMSRHQSAGQYHNLLIANKSFENVAEFRYFETTVTKENCIRGKL
jgi:hypothetical protein